MTIILDLDHTLLNTSQLKGAMRDRVGSLGIAPEQFDSTYTATVSGDASRNNYVIARHAQLLSDATQIDVSHIERSLSDALDALPNMLYADSVPFLEFLKARALHTVLLTFGNAAFQREKVERLGIAHYFDDMIFTEAGKHEAVLSIQTQTSEWVFINDNPVELRALIARYPDSRMIRIKRPDGKAFAPADDALDVETYESLNAAQKALE